MALNFNAAPYYDNYDEAKEFYKILFKPGYAVQTRELNQLQSIIQKQIEVKSSAAIIKNCVKDAKNWDNCNY